MTRRFRRPSLQVLNGGSTPQNATATELTNLISSPTEALQNYSEKLCFAWRIYEVGF